MPIQPTYQDTVTAYITQLQGLFTPPHPINAGETITRGTIISTTESLATRAEELAETSQRLGEMTAGYLEIGEQSVREAAEMKMLAQANADIEMARALLELANREQGGMTVRGPVRMAIPAELQRSLSELTQVLEAPLGNGMQPFLARTATRNVPVPSDDELQARFKLQAATQNSLRDVTELATESGEQALRVLILMDASTLLEGVRLVDKDLAEMLDDMVKGLSGALRRLAAAALKLLTQAYGQILALLGRGMAGEIQGKVEDWLGGLMQGAEEEKEEGLGIFARFVISLYQPGTISVEVVNWLKITQVDADQLDQTASSVVDVARKFRIKNTHLIRLVRAMALTRQIPVLQTPQGQAILAGTLVGLLVYALYTGYDHIGADGLTFMQRLNFELPSRVEGIRKIVRKALAIRQ